MKVYRLIALLALGLAMSCSDDDPVQPDLGVADVEAPGEDASPADTAEPAPDVPPPRTVRFAHISDTHLSADPEAANNQNLAALVDHINALSPAPDLVLITGDLAHYLPLEYEAADSAPGPHHHFRDIISALEPPWHGVAGNHDYYINADLVLTPDRAARDEAIERVMAIPIHQTVVHQGISFILLNTMQGPLWDAHAGSIDNDQLAWLDDELDQGLPTLLFMHHPPENVLVDEGDDSLARVLADHPGQVKAIFGGHFHWFSEGAFEGVPSYVAGAAKDGPSYYYLAEYDRETDEVQILNREDLPFGQLQEYTCDPALDPPLDDPESFVGTVQLFQIDNAVTDGVGLAAHLGEALAFAPLVLSMDDFDAATTTFAARLTIGMPGEDLSYIAYMDQSPCEAVTIPFYDPCLESDPLDIEYNATGLSYFLTDEPIDPSWVLRILINNLGFKAKALVGPSGPALGEGVLHGEFVVDQAIEDAQMILVREYCAGHMEICQPGASEAMPLCPDEPGLDLFAQLPQECDIMVGTFSARLVLLLAAPLAGQTIHLDANLSSVPLELSAEELEGYGDPDLFSTEAGMNCAP